MADEPANRYATLVLRERISRRFGLPQDPSHQDWPIQVEDERRTAEFLDAYERERWSGDERFFLMRLVLYSYDALLDRGGDDPELRERIAATLRRDLGLHRPTLEQLRDLDLEVSALAQEVLTATPGR